MRLRDKLLLLRAKELSVILPTLQIPRTEFGKALLMNLAVFIGRGWGETSGRAQSGSLKLIYLSVALAVGVVNFPKVAGTGCGRLASDLEKGGNGVAFQEDLRRRR